MSLVEMNRFNWIFFSNMYIFNGMNFFNRNCLFFLIERHLLTSLHGVVNLRTYAVFTIFALYLTLVWTSLHQNLHKIKFGAVQSRINEPSPKKWGIQKNKVCVLIHIRLLFFLSFQFRSVILPADMWSYVVVRYFLRFKFYFLLFWGMVMYDNEVKSKEKKI